MKLKIHYVIHENNNYRGCTVFGINQTGLIYWMVDGNSSTSVHPYAHFLVLILSSGLFVLLGQLIFKSVSQQSRSNWDKQKLTWKSCRERKVLSTGNSRNERKRSKVRIQCLVNNNFIPRPLPVFQCCVQKKWKGLVLELRCITLHLGLTWNRLNCTWSMCMYYILDAV